MILHDYKMKFTAIYLAVFAALCVFVGETQAQQQINGYYEGSDGGAYFIRQIGNKIYWFGEDPKGGFANVMAGTVSGNKITASFWDVPKGKTKGAGEIVLEIQSGGASIAKVSSSVPFGATSFKKQTPHMEGLLPKGFPPEMRSRPEGFSGGESNLTGAWLTDDLSTYYIREMPNGDVVWFAENNSWGGPGGYAQPAYARVFVGKRINGLITGNWVDLPKGKATGSGVMSLSVKGAQDMTVNNPPQGVETNVLMRSLPMSLRGFADLHSHPMVNLALGGKFVHGGLDIGSLLPADSDCKHNVRATSISQALGKDNSTHGGSDILGLVGGGGNPCGDNLRQAIIDSFQEQNKAVVTPDNAVGYPSFKDYPKWNDLTHQKMWVDWVRRAYDGGQRVMVALAMNNATLAAGVSGPGDGPTDDKASADLQIKEMKSFVGRHSDFMEIAYTPQDLRRIVAANKMAIILGVELDDIGNFDKVNNLTDAMVTSEIDRLYKDMGVRYIFPVHLTDNKFGGTAIYKDIFNLSNYHQTGKFWDITCSDAGEGITHAFVVQGFDFMLAGAKATKLGIDIARFPPDPPDPKTKCGGRGHKNNSGITSAGWTAIQEMMRLGMLIDVDHMSLKGVNSLLDKSETKVSGGYPLVSGHTGLRSVEQTENSRDDNQLKRISALGGMFGLGSSGVKSEGYIRDYNKAANIMGAGRVAFGTDLNGLEKGAAPAGNACSKGLYNASFIKSKTGDKTWDFCTEGVVHYGMLPDFLRNIALKQGGSSVNSSIMQNAEMFAQMWEKAVKNGKGASIK